MELGHIQGIIHELAYLLILKNQVVRTRTKFHYFNDCSIRDNVRNPRYFSDINKININRCLDLKTPTEKHLPKDSLFLTPDQHGVGISIVSSMKKGKNSVKNHQENEKALYEFCFRERMTTTFKPVKL